MPTKIVGVHLNYRSRAAERGRTPATPSYFLKPPSSLAGDGELVRPAGSKLLGFEGEIALIVGVAAREVSPASAREHIGWYAAANDVGVADFRWADRGSAVLSKGHDGFTPIGPPLVASEIDPESLSLRTLVNGVVAQDDHVGNLIFNVGLLVADLSRFMTLEPGDVILTGTPTGTRPLAPGDVVEVEVAGASRVRHEPHTSRVRSVVVEHGAPPARFGAQPRVTAEAEAFAGGGAGAPSRLPDTASATLGTSRS